MSPLTTTGMRTASLTLRTRRQSAWPLKNWQRVRACTVMQLYARRFGRRASSGALRLAWSQPSRIFSVTGTFTAPTTASIRRCGVLEIAHQRGTGQLARHLARRAAHVDVDDVGAERLGHARALRHPARLAAGKLYDERLAARRPRPCAARRGVLGDEVLAGDHLGDDQAGAQGVRQAAKGEIGDPRHGREQHGVGAARADRCETGVTSAGAQPSICALPIY